MITDGDYVCSICGDKIYEGFENGESVNEHWCEGCFDYLVYAGRFRPTPGLQSGQVNEMDGYYDELINDEYEPANVYFTQWF